MKKLMLMTILSAFLSGSCFLYFFRDDSLGGWEIVGDQYFPEENIGALDLVWHPEDGLLLVLRYMEEDAHEDTIRVYRYNDSDWVKHTEDLNPGFPGGTVTAGILENGDLCVVPVWATSGVHLWNGTAWMDIGLRDFEQLGTRAAYFTEEGELLLALEDPTGEDPDGYEISIYTYNGYSWTLLGTGGDFSQPTEAWLAVNPVGDPVFLFADIWESGADAFRMHRLTGTTWEPLVAFPETVVAPLGCKNPIASSAESLYCVVREGESDNYINRVLEYSGTAWSPLPELPVTENDSAAQHLVIDTAGRPLLAVEDEGAFSEITVCRYEEGAWETLGIRGVTFGDTADSAVMALGDDGYLYLAYRAVHYENTAAVMRYPLN